MAQIFYCLLPPILWIIDYFCHPFCNFGRMTQRGGDSLRQVLWCCAAMPCNCEWANASIKLANILCYQ